jgi:hypothetical protein
MSRDDAELSSLATTLAELVQRLGAAAQRYERTDHDDVVAALYQAEASARAALRSVERARSLL